MSIFNYFENVYSVTNHNSIIVRLEERSKFQTVSLPSAISGRPQCCRPLKANNILGCDSLKSNQPVNTHLKIVIISTVPLETVLIPVCANNFSR